MQTSERIKDIIRLVILFCCLWIAFTTAIQAFINPKLTSTELFLNIPNSVMGKFYKQ